MLTIRRAKTEDCVRCYELSKKQEYKPTDEIIIPVEYFENYVDKLFFVAEENNTITGYILGERLDTNRAFMSLLCIDKDHMSSGVGKELLDEFRKQCVGNLKHRVYFYSPMFKQDVISFYDNFDIKDDDFTDVEFLEVIE